MTAGYANYQDTMLTHVAAARLCKHFAMQIQRRLCLRNAAAATSSSQPAVSDCIETSEWAAQMPAQSAQQE